VKALNFATKIAPECALIHLGSKEIPDVPTSTLSARPGKGKVERGERFISGENGLPEPYLYLYNCL
jgi:hypothetical protein